MKRDDALRDYGVSVILGFIGLFVVLTSFGADVGSKNRDRSERTFRKFAVVNIQ